MAIASTKKKRAIDPTKNLITKDAKSYMVMEKKQKH